MCLKKVLQQYDKFLLYKKSLDGKVVVFRKSPFNSQKDFKVFDIANQYLGSCRWIRRKLILMDSQRQGMVAEVLQNNLAIRNRRDDNRMSQDLAEFLSGEGKLIL